MFMNMNGRNVTSNSKLRVASIVTVQMIFLYSINYGNEGASPSDSGLERSVVIRKLLDCIFYILQVFIDRWTVQTYTDVFFPEVTYTRYDVTSFVK
jgi:hypothetical protein